MSIPLSVEEPASQPLARFGVWGFRFWVLGLGFGIWGLGIWGWGVGVLIFIFLFLYFWFGVWGLMLRVEG